MADSLKSEFSSGLCKMAVYWICNRDTNYNTCLKRPPVVLTTKCPLVFVLCSKLKWHHRKKKPKQLGWAD